MVELIDFLANLAIDPNELGHFIRDPDAAISASDLSEDDKTILRNGGVGELSASTTLQAVAQMTAPVTVVTSPPPLTHPTTTVVTSPPPLTK